MLPTTLIRYAALANVFMRYGSRDAGAVDEAEAAGTFAADLEELGPTFTKLGQLLSMRADLLPPLYLEALSRLQDRAEPVPVAEMYQTIEEDLHIKVAKAFSWFDSEPFASASLSQMHRATLCNGRAVLVKVQRPGITDQVKHDLAALDEIAAFADQHTQAGRRFEFAPMVREFQRALMVELDYKQEASDLRTLGRNLAGFERIVVPAPIDDYSSTRVLTMNYITGAKVTAMNRVTMVDIDPDGLAEELIRAYLHQILIDGFFHADPHPGNVLVLEEGRLALIDLGITGHLSPSLQDQLLELILTISNGRGEEAVQAAIALGEIREGFDEAGFTRDVVNLVGHYQDAVLADAQLGKALLEVNQMAGAHGMRPPAALAMVGKTLVDIDLVGRCLAPSLDINAAMRRNASLLVPSP